MARCVSNRHVPSGVPVALAVLQADVVAGFARDREGARRAARLDHAAVGRPLGDGADLRLGHLVVPVPRLTRVGTAREGGRAGAGHRRARPGLPALERDGD